ncbi:MAG: 50S ribosomal protein L17 [Chloroflexota bacterium]
MRHGKATSKFDRPTGHRLSMYRNLVTDLLHYEHVTTTEAKAKAVRPLAEKVITWGKAGDLQARRQALGHVWGEKVINKTFGELAQRYANRPGGYTRVIKLGPRVGDGAAMARLELVA